MRCLCFGLALMTACGSSPPEHGPQPGAVATPTTGDAQTRSELPVVPSTCVLASQVPRWAPNLDSVPGFGGDATHRIGVSAIANGQAPAVHVPTSDGERVCTVDYEPSCTNADPADSVQVRPIGRVELGFVRDESGASRPIARYRTVVHGLGPREPDPYGGTMQSDRCTETIEWLWLATDDGAALVASPQVGIDDEGCAAELVTRIEGGLYCIESASEACPSNAAPGCYRIEGRNLVETAAAPDPSAETPAHPWLDAEALPYPNPGVMREAVSSIRDDVVRCLPSAGRVDFLLSFDGSGRAEVLRLIGTPPLDASAERCVREAFEGMRHPPFLGSVRFSNHIP